MKALKRYDQPSQVIKIALTKAKQELVDYIVEKDQITPAEATQIIEEETLFQEYLAHKDKRIRLQMIDEMIPMAMEAFKKKVEYGSMTQAKDTTTALGILLDKAKGIDKYSAPLQIGGKNIQINVGWKPKWMKK